MKSPSQHQREKPSADEPSRSFRDLRRHNLYAERVAKMLEAKRERRIEQVIKAHRKHRSQHAR
jgi:hypothetical protein